MISLSRCRRLSVAIALSTAVSTLAGAQTPPVPGALARLRGVAFDSVNHMPLANAVVMIEGVPRIGQTDAEGRYAVDSIPPGSYRLQILHPMLDTIGVSLVTPAIVMRPGELISVDVAVPPGHKIVALRCPAAVIATRGPGALMGQVTDPDSNKAAVGAKVQLLYEEPGVLGLTRPTPRIREQIVDSTGSYRLCGLPIPMTGKVQVFRNGISSGQVEVKFDAGPLVLRSFSIASARIVATVADSTGRARTVVLGTARVTGKVLNKAGQPVQSARVSVEGTPRATLTNARGEFVLDSLPSGTQTVEVRKIGYGATGESVELGGRSVPSVTVTMGDYELPAVRVEATREAALTDVGYVDRKRSGMGYYMDGDRIRNESIRFSDLMRAAPMLRVAAGPGGRNVIQSARDQGAGCINFVVDGSQWQEMQPGDIDDYIQPSEVKAIEVYNSSNTPGRFDTPGRSGCATVVIWTVRTLNRKKK